MQAHPFCGGRAVKWQQCRAEGLIRHDPRAPDRVAISLQSAARFAEAAEKNIAIAEFEMAQLAAYNSAFNAARALLFARGYVERSHICLISALRRLYGDREELVAPLAALDKMRISRHNVQYGGALVTEEEAVFSARYSRRFLLTVQGVLGR